MSGVAMRRSARRLLVPLAVLVASLLVATEPVAASVSYSSVLKLARSQAFPTTSSALARSSSPTSSRLHVVYTSKNIDGVDDQDTGPYQGIYYRRSGTGSSWTTPKRLNSSSQHADYASVATAGTRVYVVWRTQTHIEDYENPADPYLIRFRANDNQGSSTAWRSSIALTTFGRADRPMIAATGSSVYVTYTDRGTGEIELLKSTDYGKTWGSPTAVGATVDLPGGDVLWGYHGYPVVAVTGSTVAIAYTSDDQIVSRVSTNGGTSFGAPDMRSATDASISITARSGRIGLAYADFTGVYARVRTSAGWQPWRKAASYPNSRYSQPFNYGIGAWIDPPDVVLYSTGGIGLAFSSCTTLCYNEGRASLRWRQSANNGSSWGTVVSIASGTVTTQRATNFTPSVVMVGSATRHVLWSARSTVTGSVWAPYFRTLTGAP